MFLLGVRRGAGKAPAALVSGCRLRLARGFSSISAEEGERQFVVPTYAKGGVRTSEGLEFVSGDGCTLVDKDGKEYVDFGAGIAVTVLGHRDKDWIDAVNDQMGKICHVSNLYHTRPYLQLAEKLVKNSPGMGKVFFCNSGTESAEGAIKFARVYQNAKGEGNKRNRFVAFKKAFHGRSLGALSLTYKPAIREPFAPMLIPRVDHADYNSIESLEAMIGPDVVAVMLEPVQGEGGIVAANRDFLKRARELCDEHGCLLIFDEVQIGLGRQGNGRLWSYEEYGVIPDLVTMAKPLANGLPIGAVMLSEKMYGQVPENVWLGTHGSTFAANPVVTRAALTVLDKLLAPGFLENVKERGTHMIKSLDLMKGRLGESLIKEVRRPLGDAALFAGIHLAGPHAGAVVSECLNHGVVVLTAGDDGDVLRLCPPLVVTDEQIDLAVNVLEDAIRKCVPELPTSSTKAAKLVPGGVVEVNKTLLASESVEEYIEKLSAADHTTLPEGFKVSVSGLKFFPEELGDADPANEASMNLTMIVPDSPTDKYAAMFTQNAFPGAPIKVGREILREQSPIGAVVINNKISNVHPRGGGVNDAKTICSKVAETLKLTDPQVAVFPSSTGVIGWRLPVDAIVDSVPGTISNLSDESILPAATGIMTTDTYPKARSCTIKDTNGSIVGRVTGIAKGAGMIEPNMATMLVYLLTDIDAEPEMLDRVLRKAVNSDGSFNRISVDSDESTSDTILLLSSQKKPAVDEELLQEAVSYVCEDLAQEVVRNGEGTEHVLKVQVTGAPSEALAQGIAKSIVNSPLCKTGIAGNDPNVGRIIAAIGKYLGKQCPAYSELVANKCQILLGDQVVFEDGEFALDQAKELVLQNYLKERQLPNAKPYPKHYKTVDITVHLRGPASPGCSTIVYGADLTDTYVEVNGGYRS